MGAIQTILRKSTHGLVIQGETRKRIVHQMNQFLDHTGSQRVILLLQLLEELSATEEYTLLSSAGYWDNLNDHDAVRMSTIYDYILQNFTDRSEEHTSELQ